MAPARAPEPGEIAWLALVPCALATIAAIVVLGPPLGHALLEPGSERFWPSADHSPEPVEHARFALAVLGAPLLAAAIATGSRAAARMRAPSRPLVIAAQLLTCLVLVLCVLAQRDVLLRSHVAIIGSDGLFTRRTLVIAALVAALLATIPRSPRVGRWVARLRQERAALRWACSALAVLATAIGFLAAVSTDATVGKAPAFNLVPWDMAETFAVLNGRTPLVDFHAQYAQLLSYPAAAILALLGDSVGVWTTTMAIGSALAMLALYAVLRRVVRSAPLALALYVPLLALSLVRLEVISPANIFSLWPLRFGGPCLLAWLTARHLDGAAPRRTWALFLAAGLVLLNNAEFGTAAFVATLAALACTGRLTERAAAARLLAGAAAGLVAAGLLVAAFTLARSGRLPDFALLSEFSRIYGKGGWVLEPMTPIGMHVALYATFVAAIAVATVRAVRGDGQPVLTGMLAWSGSFGLIAGGYYAGRSDVLSVISLFAPWALALMLLLVVVLRGLAARAWRRPQPAELAVLFGFGLAVCSLPQLPAPWSQIARLGDPTPTSVFEQRDALRFVGAQTESGERVAILIPLGHRVAYDLGLTNVSPYAGLESMPTVEQLEKTIGALRREGARKVFVSSTVPAGDAVTTISEVVGALQRAGFVALAQQPPFYALTDVPPASAPAP